MPAPATEPVGPLQPIAERRLTSVLFGDLVGFTGLCEHRDPEEVRELLSRYFTEVRRVVSRYGGTVEKFAGDAVMALWGVPSAHEDDAERAVRAGFDLVEAVAVLGEATGLAGLAIRVGVVTGEVAVTVGATGEGMVAGDAVNTAARVQAAASPGAVWVDEATRALTASAISYADRGERLLKGKADRVRLFQARTVVAAVGGAQRVDGLEAAFTGRERELRLVKELFHATEEDGRARLVLVSGVAGIGKSRLGWEFEKYSDGLRRSVRWHRGRCLSYGEGTAFGALAEMVRGRLGYADGDPRAAIELSLAAGLRRFGSDESEQAWLRPRLGVLLGTGTESFARPDLFAAWTVFLERVSEGDVPVVLVVEDIQYADDGLLDFLEHALATAQFPLFLLALGRPEIVERRPSLGGGRRVIVVHLEPLSDARMSELVDGLVGGLPPHGRAGLVARAEGVPLYAVETVRALIDRDIVVPRGGRYVLASGSDAQFDLSGIGAPASLQALVASRLDVLNPLERALVRDASVLGQSFSRERLAALPSDCPNLDRLLATLVRKEILSIEVNPRSPERVQYRFVQAVVGQVAYDTLSRRDRKVRHLAVARHLATQADPGDDLAAVQAQHYLDALDSCASDDGDVAEVTDTARGLLVRAAIRAGVLGSPVEALRYYRTALRLTPDPDLAAALHEGAARAALTAGRLADARTYAGAARAAHANAGRRRHETGAAVIEAQALLAGRDAIGAVDLLTPLDADLPPGSPGGPPGDTEADEVRLAVVHVLARAYNTKGDYETGRSYSERALRLAEAQRDLPVLVSALTQCGVQWAVTGAPTAGIALCRRAADLAREHHLPAELVRALTNVAAFEASRDLPAAVAAGRESFDVARRVGDLVGAARSAMNLAVCLWTAGEWAELETLLAGVDGWAAGTAMTPIAATLRGWMALARGTEAPARSAIGEPADPGDDETLRAWQQAAAAACAAAHGDLERARTAGSAALETAHATSGLDDDFPHLWTAAVEAAVSAGHPDEAERLLRLVAEAPPGLVSPYLEAQSWRLRALVAAACGLSPAETDLRRAAAALAGFGAPFYRARAELALGEQLCASGRVDEASPLLAAAAETFRSLVATPWVAAVSRAGAAVGGRTGRPPGMAAAGAVAVVVAAAQLGSD